MSKSNKGGAFEREIARQLSLWWSGGAADDWFWRSSQSGGRATSRAKKGKTTMNACGDLAAQGPEAQKLLDLITFELKRGYPLISVADIWEKQSGGFHDFLDQSAKAASLAGTRWYAVLHKRNRRDPVLVICDAQMPLEISLSIWRWDDFLIPQQRDYWQQVWEDNFGQIK